MTALKNAPSSHLIKDLRDPLSLTSLKTKATEMTVASMLSPFMGTLEKAGKAVFISEHCLAYMIGNHLKK